MRKGSMSTALLCFWFYLTPIYAAQIYVPDDYPTIQDAIDASAWSSDVIIVRPGTYAECLDFLGKANSVKSEFGPRYTVIEGDLLTAGVTFQSGEGPQAVIEGFTIRNANSGILCQYDSSPTVTKNIIEANSADDGGGITCFDCSPVITGNLIRGNWSSLKSGGIYCVNSAAIISNNIITKNYGFRGGGVHCAHSAPTIVNNTISFNTAGTGGGIYCNSTSGFSPLVLNTILWGNHAYSRGKEIYIGGTGATLSLSYCDMEGGLDSVWVGPGCWLLWGYNMLDEDPLFVNPTTGDCHLSYDSPCRNRGDNDAVSYSMLTDFECDPRITEGNVEIGADEVYYHLYYSGMTAPGGTLDLHVIGKPGATPVHLLFGSAILSPPVPTPHGNLFLNGPFVPVLVGEIPADGILKKTCSLPSGWGLGENYPVQALVGPWGSPETRLTNYMRLRVESTVPFPQEYRHDDGFTDSADSLHYPGGDFCWMHRFETIPGGETITHVLTAFGWSFVNGDPPNGTPCTVYVWDDPTNDGNPDDCVLAASAGGVIENMNTNRFNAYPRGPVVVGGTFFVGCMVSQGPNDYPAPLDMNPPFVPGTTWKCGHDIQGGFDPINLLNNSLPPTELSAGYWLLRAGY